MAPCWRFLTNGTVDQGYSEQVDASQGRPPFVWECTDLPDGLNISPDTYGATISGTPTTAGTFPCHVSVTDTASSSTEAVTVSATLSITIAARTGTIS